MTIARSRRARRYVLRLRADGVARLTIPRHGSMAEAWNFARRQTAWLARQLQQLSLRPVRPKEWIAGTEILFRGEPVKIETSVNDRGSVVQFGSESFRLKNHGTDLRPAIEKHLRTLATAELPGRVDEFAALHGLSVRRVTIRNQRSRWGSCSANGVISLNWRLVQTPPFVRDYIILHELMHLRQMNHSARFWTEVERVCPDYKKAKLWLKENPGLLEPA
ncbi:MAG TPA: SprT family zinc-dependent metalloprotease [Pseudomonadales bacterium]|nr:SprT family zinc-dependent metalloprotease [Pseudomonadales bacterium]